MKRSPLERRTPLTSSTPLPRSNLAANQGGHHQRVPRPRGRVKPAVPARILVALVARSGGVCEILLPGCNRVAIDPAHRLKQGMGGRKGDAKTAHDVLSNLLHACRFCHSHCHASPAEAYSHGWMLREGNNPLTEPALYRGQSRWLTDDGLVLTTPPPAEEANQ
jgi:hypothetical protein